MKMGKYSAKSVPNNTHVLVFMKTIALLELNLRYSIHEKWELIKKQPNVSYSTSRQLISCASPLMVYLIFPHQFVALHAHL